MDIYSIKKDAKVVGGVAEVKINKITWEFMLPKLNLKLAIFADY